jgi:hypothetical protein
MREWVSQLANQDPEVRDRARVQLMGISKGSLDRLRQVVREGPLAPSQRAALQEVVEHVYLAAEPEAVEGTAGFLGVSVAPGPVELTPGPGVRAEGMPVGVAVAQRMPGYCAYRVLRDGDVIVRLTAGKAVEFQNRMDFMNAVQGVRAGEEVLLDVLRHGKLVRVSLVLDRRPEWASIDGARDAAIAERERRASEYWEQTFGPVVGQDRS